MDGAELPADIAAETYAPTRIEKGPFRCNKQEEREDDALKRSEPAAIDAVLNGDGPQALNLDIGSSRERNRPGSPRTGRRAGPRTVPGTEHRQQRQALDRNPGRRRRLRSTRGGNRPREALRAKVRPAGHRDRRSTGSRRRQDGRAGEIKLGVPPHQTGVAMEAGSRAGVSTVIRDNATVEAGADMGAASVIEEGARIGIRATVGEKLQGDSRNRSAGAREGVSERDVRGNGSPSDRRDTGTARNRGRRKSRTGTSTVRLIRQELIRRHQSTRQLGRADRAESHASLRRQCARSSRGVNRLKPYRAAGLNHTRSKEALGRTTPAAASCQPVARNEN